MFPTFLFNRQHLAALIAPKRIQNECPEDSTPQSTGNHGEHAGWTSDWLTPRPFQATQKPETRVALFHVSRFNQTTPSPFSWQWFRWLVDRNIENLVNPFMRVTNYMTRHLAR